MPTLELTGENFESSVAANDILFVDFWASWCGPCRQFAPTYEAASEAHPDLAFGSVNTEEQHALAAALTDGENLFGRPDPVGVQSDGIEVLRTAELEHGDVVGFVVPDDARRV